MQAPRRRGKGGRTARPLTPPPRPTNLRGLSGGRTNGGKMRNFDFSSWQSVLSTLAGIALFLASPLSGYVTGQTIIADGGMLL